MPTFASHADSATAPCLPKVLQVAGFLLVAATIGNCSNPAEPFRQAVPAPQGAHPRAEAGPRPGGMVATAARRRLAESALRGGSTANAAARRPILVRTTGGVVTGELLEAAASDKLGARPPQRHLFCRWGHEQPGCRQRRGRPNAEEA